MKTVIAVSLIAIGLAGCNATTIYNAPVPVAVVAPAPVYYPPLPPVRPYYYGYRCYSVWDQTPYGSIERKVCGYT